MNENRNFKEETSEIVQSFQHRNARIKEYVNLYNLVDLQKDPVPEHGVTNFPYVSANLAISMASDGDTKIRIKAANEDEADRAICDKAERALVGITRTVDREYRTIGEVAWLRSIAWDTIVKGSTFVFDPVIPADNSIKGKKEPLFLAERWEPETCYPVYTKRGIIKFVHEYECTQDEYEEKKEELELEEIPGWKPKNRKDKVKITDYYWREREKGTFRVYNMMMANDKVVRDPDYAGGGKDVFSEIPVKGGSVLNNHASFMEGMKNAVYDFNRLYSYGLEGFRRQIKGIVVIQTEKRVLPVGVDDLLKADFSLLPLGVDEKIVSVRIIEPFGAELQYLLGHASGDMQRAAFSFFLWGQLSSGTPPSGYAYNQMRAGAVANLGSFVKFLNALRGDVYYDWLTAYKKGNYGPIKVAGNVNGRGAGMFHEEFKRSDVPDFMYVEVDQPINFPTDLMQKLTAMATALPGQKLLSEYEVLDNIWEADDVAALQKQMSEDNANKMLEPLKVIAALIDKAKVYLESGDPEAKDMARRIAMMADKLEQSFDQTTKGEQQVQQKVLPPGVPSMLGNQGSPSQAEMNSMTGRLPGQQRQRLQARVTNAGMDIGVMGGGLNG